MGNTLTITIPVDRLELIDKALFTAIHRAELEELKYRLRLEAGNNDKFFNRWYTEEHERAEREAKEIRNASYTILDAIADGLMLARRDIFTYEPLKDTVVFA